MTSAHLKAVRKETKRFSLAGIVATAVDYLIYNLISGFLHGPLILSNVTSTSISSVVSYLLNQQVVFDGERHDSRRKTLALYVIIVAVSIYVIQSAVLFGMSRLVPDAGKDLAEWLGSIGLNGVSAHFLQVNLMKIVASCAGAIWNFFMLRKYVFVPLTENPEKHVDSD